MNKKIVILGGLVVATLLAGSVLLTMQKRGQQEMVVQNGSNDRDIVQTNDSVPATWKTYSNKEYGFEVRYPETWTAEGFTSASIGLPIDCKATPEKCENFSVKFSSPDTKVQPVVFETSKKGTNSPSVSDSKAEGQSTWKKGSVGHEFTKNSSYFPIYGSCFVTASLGKVSLKKDVNFYFYTFYEQSGNLSTEEVEKICSKEISDENFDKIVGSFTVTK